MNSSGVAVQICNSYHCYKGFLPELIPSNVVFEFELPSSEQALSHLLYYFTLANAIFYIFFIGYLLVNFFTESRPATEKNLVLKEKPSKVGSGDIKCYIARIPYTDYLATLDNEAILYAKWLLIECNPLFRTIDDITQNQIMAEIVKDLIRYLEGYSAVNCPYRAYEIGAKIITYQLEKDWFDATRYLGGHKHSSNHPVIPLFSIFIAMVYHIVSGMGSQEDALIARMRIANSPISQKLEGSLEDNNTEREMKSK